MVQTAINNNHNLRWFTQNIEYGNSLFEPTYYKWSNDTHTFAIKPYLPPKPVETDEAKKIKEIIYFLTVNGAFLGGSREKLRNWDVGDNTDWDFNVDHTWLYEKNTHPLRNYIFDNFELKEYSDYALDPLSRDSLFLEIFEHKKYNHITVIVRSDLNLYKRVWNKIPRNFWEKYLWKSHPDRIEELKDPKKKKEWVSFVNQLFNTWYVMASPPNLSEWE